MKTLYAKISFFRAYSTKRKLKKWKKIFVKDFIHPANAHDRLRQPTIESPGDAILRKLNGINQTSNASYCGR